jgi:hypothetical protein
MSSQGIMCSKKGNNNPELCSDQSKKYGLCSRTGAQNQVLSMAPSTSQNVSQYQMLVTLRVLHLSFYILPRDLEGTVLPMETLWQPEELSERDYQNKHYHISVAWHSFDFHKHWPRQHIPQPERLWHAFLEK